MLAYEMYRKNRTSKANNPESEKLFKKVFYCDGSARLDEMTCEEYGSRVISRLKIIQDRLKMPLNTCPASTINLPKRTTSKSEPVPYVQLYGEFNRNKVKVAVYGRRPKVDDQKRPIREYVLDLESGETETTSYGSVVLRLDKTKYLLDGKPLFDEYVRSGIVNGDCVLNEAGCDAVADAFLDAAKMLEPRKNRVSFDLYVLPHKGLVEYAGRGDEPKSDEEFVDGFGSTATHYSDSATLTTKFLTYDDRAYTLNCKQRADFYRDLGMGAESLEKVFVDQRYVTTISGMKWVFIDLAQETVEPVDAEIGRSGLLTWIKANYQRLGRKSDGNVRSEAMVKVLCIRQSNSQQEVLVDENLTMRRLSDIFDRLPDDIPPMCLETLIHDTGKSTIWDTYMNAAKSLLAGRSVPRDHILAFYARVLARKGLAWRLDPRNASDAKAFFNASWFCLKALNTSRPYGNGMEPGESFAEAVGSLAKHYVKFKKSAGGLDNSLSEMMSYSKYDREKLRFIVARIGRGVHLANATDEQRQNMEKEISATNLGGEISDDVAHRDYSYFFFRGYYWGGNGK